MKIATIRIDRNDIFEQIARKTSYIGDKLQGQDDAYDRIAVTESDMEFFSEPFMLALAECVEMLYPYAIETSQHADTRQNNAESSQGPETETVVAFAYDIHLSLPDTLSQTTLNLASRQINDYIVSRLIAEWMLASNIESHSYWIERYTSIRAHINRTLTARTQPVRRRSGQF